MVGKYDLAASVSGLIGVGMAVMAMVMFKLWMAWLAFLCIVVMMLCLIAREVENCGRYLKRIVRINEAFENRRREPIYRASRIGSRKKGMSRIN